MNQSQADELERLTREIENFHDIAKYLVPLPGEFPRKAGIVVIDVSGHRMTDALLAAMLHQAFLLGAIYELDTFGRITRRLFEHLNTRFYQSSGAHKFVSMIYGEISEHAPFPFLSAEQPPPALFSHEHDRFMSVDPVSFPPIGV